MSQVVRAAEKFVGELSAVGAQAFAEAFASHNQWNDLVQHVETHYSPAAITRQMAVPGAAYFLARDQHGPVGMALLEDGAPPSDARLRQHHFDAPWVQLHQLYVIERARSAGVGQELVDRLLAEGCARGAQSIWLGVWSHNPRAVRFYERLGFGVIGEATFVLGNDAQRDLVMARALPGRV